MSEFGTWKCHPCGAEGPTSNGEDAHTKIDEHVKTCVAANYRVRSVIWCGLCDEVLATDVKAFDPIRGIFALHQETCAAARPRESETP